MKKLAGGIIILYRCTINDIWCMVPKIWSLSDRSFCHFGPFYALLSPSNLKIKNFEKLKKMPGDIIILQWCTKNHDHMLYCSWYMAHNRCNWYFSFWAIFCPFTSLTARKIKILKKWKKKKMPGDIIILQWCTKNHDHMLYCSWDIAHNKCNCCFSFWAIFCPFTSLTARKIKIKKEWKNLLEISSF